MKVVGYAYEADVHCVNCTRDRFKQVASTARRDENKVPMHVVDREGNPIHPLFDIDEKITEEHCGDCREPLME